MRSLARDIGQSTIEYAGVLLLVVVLLGGLALVPINGKPIAGAVSHQLAYALCVVTHGDCDQDRRPCATRSEETRMGMSIDFLVLHLGKHHVLVREDRSDGTVALSLVREDEGGIDASTGFKARLKLGKKAYGLGGELSAAVLAQTGSGSTWELSKAKADQLQHRLEAHFIAAPATDLLPGSIVKHLLPDLPPPSQTFGDKGVSASIGASVGDGVSAQVGLSANDTFGSRLDTRTGRRTYYVKRRGELEGALRASALADADGSLAKESEYAVTYDRDGVPIDLEVIESGTLKGSAQLGGRVQEVMGKLPASADGERTWVSESHLDLTDSSNREVAQRFIAQVRSPKLHLGPAVAVSKELSRLLAERAVINLRTYDTSSSAYGGSGSAGFEGVRLGVDGEVSTESSHLVAAATRGLDGLWRTRDDCLTAARTGRAQQPAI